MTYKPSPRPTFETATAIPYRSVTRHVWGDDTAGEVTDWIFVSSDRVHQLIFGLPAGGAFRHSDQFRTIFAADLVYYVLSGTGRFTVGDEEEGLGEGHAVIARGGVPHGVRNETEENLVLLVTMAPRP